MTKKAHRKQPKSTWGKLWYFIWHEDSWESWLVNIVLAFVLIKFIVYPGLGFILATSHPIVAVVSGSMYHGLEDRGAVYDICGQTYLQKDFGTSYSNWWDNCGDWYKSHLNITLDDFKKYPLSRGFAKGDIILLVGSDPNKLKVGDIIVFNKGQSYPIIHRVINIDNESMIFTTKGDHNSDSGSFDKGITSDSIIGKAIIKIPYVGYVKIFAVDFLKLFHII